MAVPLGLPLAIRRSHLGDVSTPRQFHRGSNDHVGDPRVERFHERSADREHASCISVDALQHAPFQLRAEEVCVCTINPAVHVSVTVGR